MLLQLTRRRLLQRSPDAERALEQLKEPMVQTSHMQYLRWLRSSITNPAAVAEAAARAAADEKAAEEAAKAAGWVFALFAVCFVLRPRLLLQR